MFSSNDNTVDSSIPLNFDVPPLHMKDVNGQSLKSSVFEQ